jgi:hypothetical protein
MNKKSKTPKRYTKQDLKDLERLLKLVRFENTGFDCRSPELLGVDALPATEKEVTAFIKSRTRLYTETWIVPLLNKLIERAGGIRDEALPECPVCGSLSTTPEKDACAICGTVLSCPRGPSPLT